MRLLTQACHVLEANKERVKKMGLNRIHRGKAIWYSPQVSRYERGVMNYVQDILWHRPDLDYWFTEPDRKEDPEIMEEG